MSIMHTYVATNDVSSHERSRKSHEVYRQFAFNVAFAEECSETCLVVIFAVQHISHYWIVVRFCCKRVN